MTKSILRNSFLILLFGFFMTTLIGCLATEEMRFRFELDEEEESFGTFEIVYYGMKSSETEKNKIMEDYHYLLNKISTEEENLKEWGLILKAKEIKVEEKEKLCLHLKGIFQKSDIFNKEKPIFIKANQEIILIISERANKIRATGKIIETEKNTIIFWPSSSKILEWTIVLEEFKNLPDNLTEIYLKNKKGSPVD